MNADIRVCPFCGEPPGQGVFCEACGRNLGAVEQLPTRAAWEQDHAPAATVTAALDVAGFVAAMHAAGDPGVEKLPRVEPGFLGRTQYTSGWVVRRPTRDRDDPLAPVQAGLFVTVEGELRKLDSATRGITYRGPAYREVVGPAVPEDPGLAADLTAVLRANGL